MNDTDGAANARANPEPTGLRGARAFRRSPSPEFPRTRRDADGPRITRDRTWFGSGGSGAGNVACRSPGHRRAAEGVAGAVRNLPAAVRNLPAAVRRFRRAEHGGVAIETAIAVVVLVLGFAGVMEIVHASFTDDRTARAARAAARGLALDPSTNYCAPIRRELRLADDFDCEVAWPAPEGFQRVFLGVSPSALPDTLGAGVTEGTGDMVVVRIARNGVSPGTELLVALGVARCEMERCGRNTE